MKGNYTAFLAQTAIAGVAESWQTTSILVEPALHASKCAIWRSVPAWGTPFSLAI